MKFFHFVFFSLVYLNLMGQDFSVSEENVLLIPDNIFIGAVDYLDKNGDDLLITDSRLQQVLLYSSKSKKWEKLTPSCHPGFEFRPIEAQYGDGDEIFTTNSNSGIWGFRFKKNGTCIGAAHDKFIAPSKFDYGKELIGRTTDRKNTVITGWDSTGKPANNYFDIVNIYPTAEHRLARAGDILEVDGTIYTVKGMEPVLYTYDIAAEKLNLKKLSHQSFSFIDEDLPEFEPGGNYLKAVQKLFNTATINVGLYSFNNEYLTLVVRKRGTGESIADYFCFMIEKKSLEITDYIKFDDKVVHVGDNEIITVKRHRIAEEEERIELVSNKIEMDD